MLPIRFLHFLPTAFFVLLPRSKLLALICRLIDALQVVLAISHLCCDTYDNFDEVPCPIK
jgi:hypothetical protein